MKKEDGDEGYREGEVNDEYDDDDDDDAYWVLFFLPPLFFLQLQSHFKFLPFAYRKRGAG